MLSLALRSRQTIEGSRKVIAGLTRTASWTEQPLHMTPLHASEIPPPKRTAKSKKDRFVRRPPTAYVRFMAAVRPTIIQENPDLEFSEISREAGRRWKELGDAEKEPFVQEYEADAEEYKKVVSKISKVDPKKPKRPLSAFFLYSSSERAVVLEQNPNFTVQDVAKELGRRWSELPADAKSRWNDLYTTNKAEYDDAIAEYSGVDVNKPKRPPTAYNLYFTETRPRVKANNPGLTPQEILKRVGEEWTALSTGDKKVWEEAYAVKKAEYEKELAAYKGEDPDKPKRPPTAYFLFAASARDTIKASHPDLTTQDIARKAGEMWKAMSDTDKVVWYAKYAKKNAAYKEALRKYEAEGYAAKKELQARA